MLGGRAPAEVVRGGGIGAPCGVQGTDELLLVEARGIGGAGAVGGGVCCWLGPSGGDEELASVELTSGWGLEVMRMLHSDPLYVDTTLLRLLLLLTFAPLTAFVVGLVPLELRAFVVLVAGASKLLPPAAGLWFPLKSESGTKVVEQAVLMAFLSKVALPIHTHSLAFCIESVIS